VTPTIKISGDNSQLCLKGISGPGRWILMLGNSLMMNYTGSKPDAAGVTTETKTSGSCPVFSTP
jgi:hypothetical protein